MIFCTFDGFRKNRPKSIYNRRSFYYNRNVRLFIKSASACRSKPAPVHSTVCLSYHVFHKKKRGFCFYRKFFCTYFSIVPEIYVQFLWEFRKNDCRIYANLWELPAKQKSVGTWLAVGRNSRQPTLSAGTNTIFPQKISLVEMFCPEGGYFMRKKLSGVKLAHHKLSLIHIWRCRRS